MGDYPSVIERLMDYLYSKDLKPTTVEKMAGLGNGTLTKALSGKGSIQSGNLEKIFRVFPDLNPGWLFGRSEEEELTGALRAEEPGIEYLLSPSKLEDVLENMEGKASNDAEMQDLVRQLREKIKDLMVENSELKNKIIKLYEDRDKIYDKVQKNL